MKNLLILLSLSFAPLFANANCFNAQGDYVITFGDDVVLVRLEQNQCASLKFSLMSLQGDTVVPWLSAEYQAGAGLKDAPWPSGVKYELLLNADDAQISVVQDNGDGTSCLNTALVQKDAKTNLSGDVTTKCGSDEPSVMNFKLLRLQ